MSRAANHSTGTMHIDSGKLKQEFPILSERSRLSKSIDGIKAMDKVEKFKRNQSAGLPI